MWDFETALFGDPSRDIASMASSSKYVGWYFEGKKDKYVDFEKKTFDPELKRRVMKYYELAKTEPVTPLAQQFKKDELLDREKVYCDTPMARNINGHDLAYNIFLRMCTGDYVDKLVKHHSQGATAIGVNPHSVGWGQLRGAAVKHGNIFAGDLSKQEATTTDVFAQAFTNEILYYYCNCNDEERTIIRNALAGLNGYMFIVNGSVYECIRGHSSGHFLTAVYNSFQVWAAHKYIFEITVTEGEFSLEVSLKVLGDDSTGSASDKVKDVYNMLVLEQQFKEQFGMKYTSPAKDGKSMAFIEDHKLDIFLGRSFVKVNEKVVGPLRKVAIYDMLMYSTHVPGIADKDVIQMRTEAAFRELSLYSQEEYNKVKNWVNRCYDNSATKRKLKPRIPDFRETRAFMLTNWHQCDSIDFKGLPKKVLA